MKVKNYKFKEEGDLLRFLETLRKCNVEHYLIGTGKNENYVTTAVIGFLKLDGKEINNDKYRNN